MMLSMYPLLDLVHAYAKTTHFLDVPGTQSKSMPFGIGINIIVS